MTLSPRLLLLVLLGASLGLGVGETNQPVIPQPPITVACDDTGTVSYSLAAGSASNASEVVRIDVWNTGAVGVCIRYCAGNCASGAPDRTSMGTCNAVLGPYAGGVSTPDILSLQPGLDVEQSAGQPIFECDSSAAATLVVTEWRRVSR